ncbi:MAG TPA: hypothetical protein VEC19_01050 [Usitatibacter sp.]|nr:hypothetical protein [Usitatibacter sp.]
MNIMQKIIYTGFATCALASASMPAFSWTVWPNVDFEWYADVGKLPAGNAEVAVFPAPRTGYIWAPGHYESVAGSDRQYIPGRWIVDDHQEQVARYSVPAGTQLATGPTVLYDRDGRPIPTHPDAYPIDSVRR